MSIYAQYIANNANKSTIKRGLALLKNNHIQYVDKCKNEKSGEVIYEFDCYSERDELKIYE